MLKHTAITIGEVLNYNGNYFLLHFLTKPLSKIHCRPNSNNNRIFSSFSDFKEEHIWMPENTIQFHKAMNEPIMAWNFSIVKQNTTKGHSKMFLLGLWRALKMLVSRYLLSKMLMQYSNSALFYLHLLPFPKIVQKKKILPWFVSY